MFSFFSLFHIKKKVQEEIGQIQEVEVPVANKRSWKEPEDYELKECFWDGKKDDDDSYREAVVYEWLLENLSEDYYCFPHVSLREIFRFKESFDKTYLQFLAPFHVDYLIVGKKNGKVVVAIELDGITHKNNKAQMKADGFKENVFAKQGIPLIRIENLERDFIYESLKKELKRENLYGKLGAPVYCMDCGRKMDVRWRADKEDKTVHFYYCLNCKRPDGKNKTLSIDKIKNPDVLKNL